MFALLLAVLLVAWAVHVRRARDSSPGELLLLYVLIGYCGIPMVLVAGIFLVHPHEVAHMLGVDPDHPFGAFLGWAYLGMALSASMVLRHRGTYLVGPTIVWAVFFAGATGVHLGLEGGAQAMGHGSLLAVLASHALVSVLLVAGLWTSGLMGRGAGATPRS